MDDGEQTMTLMTELSDASRPPAGRSTSRVRPWRVIGAALLGLVLLGAAACDPMVSVLPTPNANFDYQIGGAYPPPAGVTVVSRDRSDPPAPGLYNICYVNGFQGQTEDQQWWLTKHPTLVLRNSAGQPVKDTDWNELILDISTSAKRSELAGIVGGWISACGTSGYQAVEVDNLDSYTRSGGRLTQAQAVSFIRLLADRAHAANMAIGQKNGSEMVGRKAQMGTDFAIAEECNRYTECDSYTAGYGTGVFVIEYRRADFDKGCRQWPQLSIVLRDRDVRPAGTQGYVRAAC
jgi:hypothetical protein